VIDKLLPKTFRRLTTPADEQLYIGLVPPTDLWSTKFQWILLEYGRLLMQSLQSQGHNVKWAPFKLHDLDGVMINFRDQNNVRYLYVAQQTDLFNAENKVYSETRRVQKCDRKNRKTKKVAEYARVILEGRILRLVGLNLGEDYDVNVYQSEGGKPYIMIVPGATMSVNIKEVLAEEIEDDEDEWIELPAKKTKDEE
jgi:hypothetical protein